MQYVILELENLEQNLVFTAAHFDTTGFTDWKENWFSHRYNKVGNDLSFTYILPMCLTIRYPLNVLLECYRIALEKLFLCAVAVCISSWFIVSKKNRTLFISFP